MVRLDRIHDVHNMESSRQPTRMLRTIGVSAGVLVLAIAALVSGCYYREYGHRGYDHRHDRRY